MSIQRLRTSTRGRGERGVLIGSGSLMSEAEPDMRTLTHLEWFREFCEVAHVDFCVESKAPPHHPVQFDLI